MPQGGFNLGALTLAIAGGVLAYSGVRGKHISSVARSILAGNVPTGGADPGLSLTDSITSNASGSADIGSIGTIGAIGGSGAPQVESFLKSKTKNKAMIAGIMGNIQIESSFNSEAENTGEGAIGYCQWEGGRRTNLQKFASTVGRSEKDSATQLAFMWRELTTAYVLVLAAMKIQTNPETAAAIFDSQYEKSAGTSRGDRESAARAWFNKI